MKLSSSIQKSDQTLSSLGFTEHSLAHVTQVAEVAGYILETLGYSERRWNWPKSLDTSMI